MKNNKIRRISIVMSLLLLFNSLGMFASDSISQDEVLDSSLTDQTESVVLNSSNIQARMGKYYSDYDEADLYDTMDELLYRANCYGYAFRMFYAPNRYPTESNGGQAMNYVQLPGEFAVKTTPIYLQLSPTETYSISNHGDIENLFYNKIFSISNHSSYDLSYKINAIETLMTADMSALNYNLIRYTDCTVPSATTYRNKRLIALVVNSTGFHFYMQHSDDTWSHKNGPLEPQNSCIAHSTPLTNDNILSHACEGSYTNGVVRLYYIDKDAVVDYKHRDGTANNCAITRPLNSDHAGNHMYAAKIIDSFPEEYLQGEIDYPGDIDYYSIYSSDRETRTIHVTTSTDYIIQLTIYQGTEIIMSQSSVSNVSVTIDLEIDTQYYIVITLQDYGIYQYILSYDFW